jgi:hypothetical protein
VGDEEKEMAMDKPKYERASEQLEFLSVLSPPRPSPHTQHHAATAKSLEI